MVPIGGPVCEVVAVAKRDLKAGERLDGIGGFCSYGLIDNTATARSMSALPIGLSEDCVLRRDIAKDAVLSFDDVISPSGRSRKRYGGTRWRSRRLPLARGMQQKEAEARLC